ncbi:hypothetical protein RchiOBHm_Chr4g0400071 [Rosa chinensis]|uniref:Uncharacterized protein n=1 Tax=Rosa chinensis TaxID=74649 RepID=A0A2P6QSR1_ROSCH|nr:hypothetical protein RchiOBHm_Chr4g0400071 [Rosa chinensis]
MMAFWLLLRFRNKNRFTIVDFTPSEYLKHQKSVPPATSFYKIIQCRPSFESL